MEPILKGISAFVEVWSSNRTENYSKTFEQQLLDMGAKVSKTFNKQVTHVVFKEGRLATWRKAQKTGVKIVSVLWVEKCRETGVRVDESLFPAVYTNEGLPLLIKKHKCMQPKDFVEKTPENDRKLQRRLDQMAKELAIQKTASNAEADIPVLLFEDDGSLVYSPVNKIKDQCSAMERRIKEMKEKRENLSLTASQISQILPCNSPKDCPPSTCVLTDSADALPEKQMEDCLNSSFDDLWGTDKFKRRKTEVAEHISDAQSDVCVSKSASVNSPSCSYDQKTLTPKQSNRRCLGKKQILQHTSDGKLSSEKKDFKKFPNKNQIDENTITPSAANKSSLLQIKGLRHVTPSEETVQLHTTPALIGSLSNSPVSHEGLSICSFGRNVPVDVRVCTLEDKRKKKPKVRSSLKLTASKLGASESEKEILQAVPTYNKPLCSEEAAYEDYFSSSNLNENELQIWVPKKAQNPPEVCCNDSFRKIESLDVSFCKPHSTSEKSREKYIPANDVSVENDFKPNEHPESIPLNCMSDGENTENTEALDSDIVDRHALDKSYKTNMNCYTHATGKIHFRITSKEEDAAVVTFFLNGISDENEVSECHVTDGSCKLFNEQENKLNGGLRKNRRLQKPTRTLVMTSMSSEKQNTIIQVVNKLGDFLFSDDVCETTSHVVAGSPRRTLNVMLGIARGCWIVSYEWVLWSLELGHWTSEEPYELSSNFPAAPICRLQRHLSTGKYQQNLFSSQPAMFVSPTSQPPCKKLIELIQLSGGKICKALRQAKICIGGYPAKKNQEIKYLSEKWILDSITQHTVCPMENYIFQP
ncbi:microcephalin isoform X2 [Struthio camelus]|uniref:microcephalin isoform X2 n=1 Tax=Struthio camelus TaxID=8801 RepID=UPI0036041B2C